VNMDLINETDRCCWQRLIFAFHSRAIEDEASSAARTQARKPYDFMTLKFETFGSEKHFFQFPIHPKKRHDICRGNLLIQGLIPYVGAR